jgi:hypothetical protein
MFRGCPGQNKRLAPLSFFRGILSLQKVSIQNGGHVVNILKQSGKCMTKVKPSKSYVKGAPTLSVCFSQKLVA